MANGGDAVAPSIIKRVGQVPQQALSASKVRIVQATREGLPNFIRRDIAFIGPLRTEDRATMERELVGSLSSAVAPFGLRGDELRLRKVNKDPRGAHHLRYAQVHNGLDVVGGDLVVHLDTAGRIYAINGTARGHVPSNLGARDSKPARVR
jgi:vibriolysin